MFTTYRIPLLSRNKLSFSAVSSPTLGSSSHLYDAKSPKNSEWKPSALLNYCVPANTQTY